MLFSVGENVAVQQKLKMGATSDSWRSGRSPFDSPDVQRLDAWNQRIIFQAGTPSILFHFSTPASE
ncbi:hypothetical protein [Rhizobium sp. SGZ-381]|uniref:hypothetical protein n=1 Tax=Rhizobium sp. SGZ-381 TaxID=3342800 RepID=UPI00366D4C01